MPYNIELGEKKDSLIQLETSKWSMKDLFNDLLDETKGFIYQITPKVYFKNTKTLKLNFLLFFIIQQKKKTVINRHFTDVKSFQEILYRTDNWIIESSGWMF